MIWKVRTQWLENTQKIAPLKKQKLRAERALTNMLYWAHALLSARFIQAHAFPSARFSNFQAHIFVDIFRYFSYTCMVDYASALSKWLIVKTWPHYSCLRNHCNQHMSPFEYLQWKYIWIWFTSSVYQCRGKHNLWFIGGGLSFESVHNVMAYNQLLIDRMKSKHCWKLFQLKEI